MRVLVLGANGGIGSAIADSFPESVAVERADLRGAVHNVDVRSLESVDDLRSKVGHVDTIVNAAGLYRMGFFSEISYEDHLQILLTNVVGALNVYTIFLNQLKGNNLDRLHFIDINALTSNIIYGGNAVAAGSKSAVRIMSKELSVEVDLMSSGESPHPLRYQQQARWSRVYCDSVDTGIYKASEGQHVFGAFPMMPAAVVGSVASRLALSQRPYQGIDDIAIKITGDKETSSYNLTTSEEQLLEVLPWSMS